MKNRLTIVSFIFLLWFLAVLFRLFYWQGVRADELAEAGRRQYERSVIATGDRGIITTADGYPLVLNEPIYTVAAIPDNLSMADSQAIPLLLAKLASIREASSSAQLPTADELLARIRRPNRKWVPLIPGLTKTERQAIEELEIDGIAFEQGSRRVYPEASLAAHLTGFLGKDERGLPRGYFGIEGKYNLELQGRLNKQVRETDAVGHPLLSKNPSEMDSPDGRSLTLTLRRDIQYLVARHVLEGMQKYGAKAIDVVVMDPLSGKILASVAYPNYDPARYGIFPQNLLKNPVVADGYEPGSTFKVLTIAAGIELGKISPSTRCMDCAGPKTIGKYTIKTWNNQYTPGITMQEALTKSDNTAMVSIASAIGKDDFLSMISKFGIGEKTGVDLQDETSPRLRERKDWSEIDIATASFGQGIALTPIQMLNAVNVIANGGVLLRPTVVSKITSDEQEFVQEPTIIRQVISKETAETVARMMQESASNGDARWTLPRSYSIAGKTGTAQIPIDGHYDAERTIASFVGFSPAQDPKFSMLVRIVEPTSSQWGSETAAPLWFAIAKDLFVNFGITPSSTNE